MKISKEKILFFSSLLFVFLLLELILRTSTLKLPTDHSDGYVGVLYSKYTNEELNLNLPYRHKFHGGECVKNRFFEKMEWHPRFGLKDKNVDLECIDSLFSEGKINIVFLGGSAMANNETPNYLTSIEYYMFNDDDKFRTINLSESGARLSNELAIFIEYIPKLKVMPHVVMFFDGYNEFNGIRYNGEPDSDFYWTASVDRRIHNPMMFYIDAIIDKSFLLKFIYNNIFNYSSSREQKDIIEKSKVINSANDYKYRKLIIEKLCEKYEIKCIFVIQPNFVLSKNLVGETDNQISNWHKKYFKNDELIYRLGYKTILSENDNIYDLTNIFDSQSNIYFDFVHTNKFGSKIIGKKLRKILDKELEKIK